MEVKAPTWDAARNRRHEDVFRFHVAVRDLVLVQIRERARELPEYRLRARLLRGTGA
jgi:hypothetical protein